MNCIHRAATIHALKLSVLLALTAAGALAQEPVTCALIPGKALEFHESATLHLLNVALSNQRGLALLERAEIERIVEERSLQLAFGADGVSARRQLGSVLQARLLVIMLAGETPPGAVINGRPPKPTTRYVLVVVADTESGLRLATETRVWDDADPEATVAALAEVVERASKKANEKVTAIAAVPPFVNDDLTHEHDALQEAYAQLIRAQLLATPGVRVVEMAEAQAVAKEQAMTGGDSIERLTDPLYVLGRFRNEGRGPQRRVTLSLEIKLREQILLESESEPLEPAAVSGFLKEALAKLTDKALISKSSTFDAESEIRALSERADVFERLGAYDASEQLIEVALLLTPTRTDLRARVFRLCGLASDAAHTPTGDYAEFASSAREAIGYNLRGLEHLEHLLRSPETRRRYLDKAERQNLRNLVAAFWKSGQSTFFDVWLTRDLEESVWELGRQRQEAILAVLESFQGDNEALPGAVWMLQSFAADPLTPIKESSEERLTAQWRLVRIAARDEVLKQPEDYDHRLSILKMTQSSPIDMGRGMGDEEARMRHRLSLIKAWTQGNPVFDSLCGPTQKQWRKLAYRFQGDRSGRWHDAEAFGGFLDQVEAVGKCGAYAARFWRLMLEPMAPEERLARMKKLAEEAQASDIPEPAKTALSTELQNHSSTLKQCVEEREMEVNGTLVNLAGKVERAYVSADMEGEKDFLIERVKGRSSFFRGGWTSGGDKADLVWGFKVITAHNGPDKFDDLLRLDPTGGEIKSVIYDGRYCWAHVNDDLVIIDPAKGPIARVEAGDGLPPGELDLAPLAPGRIFVVGSFERLWCANISYAPPGTKKVDVFHEARSISGELDDPFVAFKPERVFALRPKEATGATHILIERRVGSLRGYLAVDPISRSVRVVARHLPEDHRDRIVAEYDGALYWVTPGPHIRSDYFFWKQEAPDFEEKLLFRANTRALDRPFHSGAMSFIDGHACLFSSIWNANLRCFLVDYEGRRLIETRSGHPDLPDGLYVDSYADSSIHGHICWDKNRAAAYGLRWTIDPSQLLALPDDTGPDDRLIVAASTDDPNRVIAPEPDGESLEDMMATQKERAKQVIASMLKHPVNGVVFDSQTRKPIAGATIAYQLRKMQPREKEGLTDVHNAGTSYAESDIYNAVSDAEGRFVMGGGNYEITLTAAATGYVQTQLIPERFPKPNSLGQIEVSLDPGGARIEGVYTVGGVAQPFIRIHLGTINNWDAWRRTVTDEDGRFTFESLMPREYAVYADNQHSITHREMRVQRRVKVGPGESATCALGEEIGSGALVGRLLDNNVPSPGETVTLVPSFEWDYGAFHTMTDQHGRYHFEGLRDGEYRLTWRRWGLQSYESVTVENLTSHDARLEQMTSPPRAY